MEELAEMVRTCRRCSLWKHRLNPVVGEGCSSPRLMFIGEAPGRSEDLQGRPFVGAAGRFLTSLIEGMGLRRDEVYITNIVKCRPPKNRDPLPEEIEACSPFLDEQLKILKPKIVATLGKSPPPTSFLKLA